MQTKTELLDSLFIEWKSHYTNMNIDIKEFNCDGIINESKYNAARKKLLFILREPNQSLKDNDIRKDVANGPCFGLWYELSRWAYGIINNFPDFDIVEKDIEGKKEVFLGSSIMNLKKIAGGGSTDFNELNLFAYIDRDFIKREIEIIGPDLIICCNSFIELMWALELKGIKDTISDLKTVFEKVYYYNDCPIYVFPYHPAHRKNRKKSYNDLKETFLRNR